MITRICLFSISPIRISARSCSGSRDSVRIHPNLSLREAAYRELLHGRRGTCGVRTVNWLLPGPGVFASEEAADEEGLRRGKEYTDQHNP